MRQLAFVGLLIAAVVGCDDSDSQDAMSGLPLTQADMAEVAVIPEEKTETKEEARPVPSVKGPWPKVVAGNTTHEFGRMQLGTKLETTFSISNEGDTVLNLLTGESTCKCTKFELESTSLEPGESTVLNIEWHGKLVDKNFQHGGPVYTNDPERTQVDFAVRGVVAAPFKVMPENNWRLGAFVKDEPATTQAVICSSLFEDFEVTSIECGSPFVSAVAETMSREDLIKAKAISGYYINVEISSDLPPGYLTETLRITVDGGEPLEMNIDISATREGPIKVVGTDGGFWIASKNGLKLGQFQTSAGREAVMTLSVAEKDMTDPLEIVSSEIEPRFLSVTLEPAPETSGTMKRYFLTVRVPPGIPKTSRSSADPATVFLKTNHPTAPKFRFGVSFKAF